MEEIIIDGINVAGCGHFKINKGFNCYKGYNCTEKECFDCHYKQLKRLEQENAELEKELKSQQMINLEQQEIALDYWNTLEEIRGICSNTCDTNKDCIHSCYECKSIDELVAINRILDKINEVLEK